MNQRRYIFIFFIFFVFRSYAQFSYSLPAYFVDFHLDPSIGNPALFDRDHATEANVHYKSFFGPYAELKAYHGNISKVLGKRQFLGLRFQSEHEGQYFQRNRIHFVYGYEIPVQDDLEITLAGYTGGIIYNYESIGNFQGGQDQNFDLGFGLRLTKNDFTVAFSGNQLNQAELQPIDYQFKINRFYEAYGSYSFRLNDRHTLFTEIKYRHTHQKLDRIAHLLIYFTPKNELYKLGLHYLHQRGISPSIACSLPIDAQRRQRIQVSFSFFVLNTSYESSLINNQYDISIQWFFLNRKKGD